MAWYITVHVTDCATGAALSTAIANDGVTNSSPSGPTGNITLEINDEGDAYGIQIICFGYYTKPMTLLRSQAGTVQNICLDKVSAPPPKPPGDGPCFIVTAATGSAESEEIVRLRRLRDW